MNTNSDVQTGTGTAPSRWTVVPESFTTADAIALRRDYFAEVAGRYWEREATEAEIDQGLAEDPATDLLPPTGEFFVGRYGDSPAACAGIRRLDDRTAELTRVYVRPALRGTGGGAALLAAVEDAARGMGAERIRLDTRSDLVEARALYTRHGYAEIPAYNSGPYAQHWFEKKLV
ncbi:GNAT family N-acetyltransferase [Streptomyces sp. NPDC089919]|uniref:GNAT family N-acetyltransferase n=1 Tax=Streptomyces sp. NPDC089919 TaxID=3155188 RepID=UPI003429D7D2